LNELEAVEGQIEELQTDKESMKMLLDGNGEEISDLKLSAKKLEVENMALKKDVAALQKQLAEVKLTAAGDKEEVRSLKAEYKALKKDVEELRCSAPEKSEKKMNNNWYCDRESARTKYDYYAQKDTKREVFQNISESGSTHSSAEESKVPVGKRKGIYKQVKNSPTRSSRSLIFD